jgi:hypothetical protein
MPINACIPSSIYVAGVLHWYVTRDVMLTCMYVQQPSSVLMFRKWIISKCRASIDYISKDIHQLLFLALTAAICLSCSLIDMSYLHKLLNLAQSCWWTNRVGYICAESHWTFPLRIHILSDAVCMHFQLWFADYLGRLHPYSAPDMCLTVASGPSALLQLW